MNRACRSRRGSALLIVLGMVTFLVVSAVSFSIFMRQNRLPSSFTRQRTNALLLTKAALACALSDLDSALADDPYPGVGHRAGNDRSEHRDIRGERCFNRWVDRVFWNSDENITDGDVMTYRSISVPPLEGFGYLPPALVNSVRYWGRRVPSAGRLATNRNADPRVEPTVYTSNWKDLGYDSGRYVYVAVNVSDYFDINRLHADLMRDSTSSNRISLAYLFENSGHTSEPSGTDKFDAAVDKVRKSAEGSFASLLDYNLWLGGEGSGLKIGDSELKSPFCEFVKGSSKKEFVRDPEMAKLQTFITQSWYPAVSTNANVAVVDESDSPIKGLKQSLLELGRTSANSPVMTKLFDRLNFFTLASLYDYLDKDDEPISLAMPTVERTPMLTGVMLHVHGIKPEWNVKREVVASSANEIDPDTGKPRKDVKLRYSLRSLGDDPKITMRATALFPFRREGLFATGTFKAQVLTKIFFVRGDQASKLADKVRFKGKFSPKSEEEWKPNQLSQDFKGSGIFTAVSEQHDVKMESKIISSEQDALIEIKFPKEIELRFAEGEDALVAYAATYPEGQFGTKYQFDPKGMDGQKKLTYVDAGTDGDFAGYVGKATEIDPTAGGDYLLCTLFWVRLIDGNGKTVDLAPATLTDDVLYNGGDRELPPNLMNPDAHDYGGFCGPDIPYFPAVSAVKVFSISDGYFKSLNEGKEPGDGVTSVQPPKADPAVEAKLSLYCTDPRFNYAPEDWFKADMQQFGRSEWYAQTDALRKDRDGDLFMFVSNQGYLQSVGELFMLPYTGAPLREDRTKNKYFGNFLDEGKYNGKFATGPDTTANRDFVWRTYYGWGDPKQERQNDQFLDVYNWDILDSRKGVYVNPYTEDINIFMAALANTPYDWSVCATNENGALLVSEEVKKLCFNEYAEEPSAKLKWEDLKKVGEELRGAFRNLKDPFTDPDWRERWNDEGLLGYSSPEIVSCVDRKFLYAFWRSCLQNRQHLFLVFVRAEPMVISGTETTDTTQTPAQLGGRAVALVWRDPKAPNVGASYLRTGDETSETTCPHRTRILFYHQFDK